jgi:hypothetical protein
MDKAEYDYVKEHAKQVRELEKFIPKIPVLDGFVSDWVEDDNFKSKSFVMTNEVAAIKLTFRPGGDGTTEFKNAEGHWLSFDRCGVESSFYWKAWDYKGADPVDIEAVVAEQIARVAKSREYYKTAIKVPDVGFTTSPDGMVKLQRQLITSGYVHFHPSGFGTGYTVTRAPRYGARRAKPELEKFFNLSPLYVETFDAD